MIATQRLFSLEWPFYGSRKRCESLRNEGINRPLAIPAGLNWPEIR